MRSDPNPKPDPRPKPTHLGPPRPDAVRACANPKCRFHGIFFFPGDPLEIASIVDPNAPTKRFKSLPVFAAVTARGIQLMTRDAAPLRMCSTCDQAVDLATDALVRAEGMKAIKAMIGKAKAIHDYEESGHIWEGGQ